MLCLQFNFRRYESRFYEKLNANDLNDMLKDAGVSSAVHRHQIIEACHENNNNTPNVVLEDVTGENNEHFFDVYLSHAGSSHGCTELASLLGMISHKKSLIHSATGWSICGN